MRSFRSLAEDEEHLAHMPGLLLHTKTRRVLEDNGVPAVHLIDHPDYREAHHFEDFDADDYENDDERDHKIMAGLVEHGWKRASDVMFYHPNRSALQRYSKENGIMWKLRTPR